MFTEVIALQDKGGDFNRGLRDETFAKTVWDGMEADSFVEKFFASLAGGGILREEKRI